MTAARLTIDLAALAHNYAVVRDAAPGAEAAPVVKADGYGLGVGPISRRLWDEGARSFFVARCAEGEALRREIGGREARIFVLDGVQVDNSARLAESRLTPVVNSLDQIDLWKREQPRLPCAIHLDTGMNRLGVPMADWEEARRRTQGLELVLVMSHLSAAMDPARTQLQAERFRLATTIYPRFPHSLAASGGIFAGSEHHFDTVRPGIVLYGGGPFDTPDPRIKPVAVLEAPILQVRDISAGDFVGYGGMFTAKGPMRIALLGAGYADGVLRASHARGQAAVRGRTVPLLAVSMDLIAIDISDLPELKPGEPVELLGPNVQLDEVAAAAGTVAHECLVRLGSRADRIYLEG